LLLYLHAYQEREGRRKSLRRKNVTTDLVRGGEKKKKNPGGLFKRGGRFKSEHVLSRERLRKKGRGRGTIAFSLLADLFRSRGEEREGQEQGREYKSIYLWRLICKREKNTFRKLVQVATLPDL